MTAAVIPFRPFGGFRTIADAVAWSDANRVHRNFWLTYQVPVVDASGLARVDDFLAAYVGMLMELRSDPEPTAARVRLCNKLADQMGRMSEAHVRAGEPLEAAEQLIAQATLQKWGREIERAAEPMLGGVA